MKKSKHSAGVDFYDHGYKEDEVDEDMGQDLDLDHAFVGRQEQLLQLQEYYEANVSSSFCKTTPLVILEGPSGVGKSRLVHAFATSLQEKACNKNSKAKIIGCPLLLAGKYSCSNTSSSTPFAGIAQSLTHLVAQVQDQEDGDKWKRRLGRLRPQIEVLAQTIAPALMALASSMQDDDPDASEAFSLKAAEEADDAQTTSASSSVAAAATCLDPASSNDSQNAWHRLRYAFQTFLRGICTKEQPVILFLDDIQWMDQASLDLISSLLTDRPIACLLLIGTVRSADQIPHGINPGLHLAVHHLTMEELYHALIQLLRLVQDTDLDLSLRKQTDEDDYAQELQQSLMELTQVVYETTQGNMFFVVETLKEMQRMQILYYCHISFHWKWNLETTRTFSSNVLVERLMQAPTKVQRIVVVLAFTKSSLSMNTLIALLRRDPSNRETTEDEWRESLDRAVRDGFLQNPLGSSVYSFGHDRIQQAAQTLVTDEQEQGTLKEWIGQSLYDMYRQDETWKEDWMIFVAAEYLQDSTCDNTGELLARLELQVSVGEIAARMAAFASASYYLDAALKFWKRLQEPWEENTMSSLGIRLFKALSQVKLNLGDFDLGESYGKVVLDKANSVEDKLATYQSLAQACGRQEKHKEALTWNRTALALLGEKEERNHVGKIVRYLLFLRRYLKKHTDSDILLLPLMKDENKARTMNFLSDCSLRHYLSGNPVGFMASTLRQLRISLKYGLCPFTATALDTYGVFLGGTLGDQPANTRLPQRSSNPGALRMARLATGILDATRGDPYMQAKHDMASTLFIDAFCAPPLAMIERCKRAYKNAMAAGDLELAMLSWLISNHMTYAAGYPLNVVETTGADLCEKLEYYSIDSVKRQMEQLRLPVVLLSGRSSQGDAVANIDWEGLQSFQPERDSPSETYRLIDGYLARLQLGVYFGKYEFAQAMGVKVLEVSALDSGYVNTSLRLLFHGIANVEMWHRSKKRAYRYQAVSMLAELQKLTRKRGLNSHPRQLVLEAHVQSMKRNAPSEKKLAAIQNAYNRAMEACSHAGQIQDVALAQELCGETLSRWQRSSLATIYWTKARNSYMEWGARAKVDALEASRKLDPTLFDDRPKCLSPDESRVLLSNRSSHYSNDEAMTVDESLRSGATSSILHLPSSSGMSITGGKSVFSDGDISLLSSNDADGHQEPQSHQGISILMKSA